MKAKKYRRGFYGTARILGDRTADSASKLESGASDEPIQASRIATFDTPVDIKLVQYRTRLTDPDNASAKAAIDGLVHAGVISDDSHKQIREISYRQIKVKNKEDEKTVIQIRSVSE